MWYDTAEIIKANWMHKTKNAVSLFELTVRLGKRTEKENRYTHIKLHTVVSKWHFSSENKKSLKKRQ